MRDRADGFGTGSGNTWVFEWSSGRLSPKDRTHLGFSLIILGCSATHWQYPVGACPTSPVLQHQSWRDIRVICVITFGSPCRSPNRL